MSSCGPLRCCGCQGDNPIIPSIKSPQTAFHEHWSNGMFQTYVEHLEGDICEWADYVNVEKELRFGHDNIEKKIQGRFAALKEIRRLSK